VTAPESDKPAAYRQMPVQVPPGATEVFLVRHGQSQEYVPGNPFDLVDGHGDPPLSELGREQARRVGGRLAKSGIAAIYVSTLCRTAQTAAPLADALGIVPEVEADLREVLLGEWEGGLFRQMVAEQVPLAQRMFAEERWDVIPGAEPSAGFEARVRAAIGRIADAHPDQRVAAFSHGGVIGQALSLATGSRRFAFTGADNASVSRLIVDGGNWLVRGFNDTAHLDDFS
jgi:2,3-bisphosphoglycerate-dependent phosphoglycerate mutase